MGFEEEPYAPRPKHLAVKVIRIFAATVIVTLVRTVNKLDDGIQQAASRLKFHRLPYLKTHSKSTRQNVARLFFPLLFLSSFFLWHAHSDSITIEALKVPILGTERSDVNLYFPPVGRTFYPTVPKWNEPPKIRARTPLFIPFTRNDTMLTQAVLSYIAAGWPREDIVIIDNSGTLDSNNRGALSQGNPFFLDYEKFRKRYGVSILQTPTLLNFAQLQNFMLRQALARNWPFYFWSHMDVAVLSAEEFKPFRSFYQRVLNVLYGSGLDAYDVQAPEARLEEENIPPLQNISMTSDWATEDDGQGRFKSLIPEMTPHRDFTELRISRRFLRQWPKKNLKWAVKFFQFDNLVLVNVEAWRKIGAWDTFIPYYHSDCDYYGRLLMHGFRRDEHSVGYIMDIADVVQDPENRFFPGESFVARKKWTWGASGWPERIEPAGGKLNSHRYSWLKDDLSIMVKTKNNAVWGRNSWQDRAEHLTRDSIEPWSYDAKAFRSAWWDTAAAGRSMFVRKWGTFECNIMQTANKTLDDAWAQLYLDPNSAAFQERKKETDKWLKYANEGPIR